MADYLIKRNGRYSYFRRIPAHIRLYDDRENVRVALKTKDPDEARRRAAVQNEIVEGYWRDLLKNPKQYADEKYHETVALCRAHGFDYIGARDIADGRIADIMNRAQAVHDSPKNKKLKVSRAVFGGIEKPVPAYSQMFDIYKAAVQDRLIGKSEVAKRKWEAPRLRAIDNLIKVAGDKPFNQTTRRDISDLKKWWMDRIVAESMRPETANKDFFHLKNIMRAISQEEEIDINLDGLFAGIAMRGHNESREPYTAEFVQKKILGSGILHALNEDAQAIIYIMSETGARPNEIIGLDHAVDIVLNAKIPYIDIRPNKIRSLKTRSSVRQIPLVGWALKGALLIKDRGINRYDGSDSASSTINKFFKENGLKPSDKHSIYSLRHTFKDRLRDAGAPDEVKDELMGHASDRPKYGRGNNLETKLKWLNKIAFKIKD